METTDDDVGWGCYCIFRGENAELQEEQSSLPVVLSPYLALSPTEEDPHWTLCRISTAEAKKSPYGLRVNDRFLYHDSIRVHGISSHGSEMLSLFQPIHRSVVVVRRPNGTWRFHREDETKKNTKSGIRIFQLSKVPTPLLSMSLSVMYANIKTPRTPLFLAYLKRQLVGCPLVLHATAGENAVTTRFHIQTSGDGERIVLETKTAIPAFRSSQQQELFFGLILPSTRITIEYPETAPPKRKDGPQSAISPAAQCLVRAMKCMPTSGIPRSFLFAGPPGVGKTHAVREAMREMKESSFELRVSQGSELMGRTNGHAAEILRELERFFRLVDDGICVLVFLDECDALVTLEPVAYRLAHLLDSMHPNILFVAATNRVDTIPLYLRRRLEQEMDFLPPTAETRKNLLQSMLSTYQDHDAIQDVAALTVGYVAADLEALVRQAALLCLTTGDDTPSNSNDKRSILHFLKPAMATVGASALRDAAMFAPPSTTWDDIAGDPGGAKTALRQAIEWPRTKSEAYKLLGLTTPRGILLHGPPGCAKTTLARAAAGAAGVAFLSFSPADVYASSYVGEAEAVVRRAFSLARSSSPCILFFDEIDAIVGISGGSMTRGTSAEARVMSTFLNEMDGVDGSWRDKVLVLGATNRVWTLDAALLRPGRFDKVIYVPPPDLEGRKALFTMSTCRWTFSTEDPLCLDELVRASEHMTGAEIKGVCQAAAMRAFREGLQDGRSVPLMKQSYILEELRSTPGGISDPTRRDEFSSSLRYSNQIH